MNAAEYLKRINYSGPTEPAPENLKAIHLAHMYSVPFENLDIPLGIPIELDLDRIFEKVVTNRRGGFCYELNGLFARLLKQLGFEVEMLSARVFKRDGELSPEFSHMLLCVNKKFVADVGFGDSFVEPLRFTTEEQSQPNGVFRLAVAGDTWRLEKQLANDWQLQYEFNSIERKLDEYREMCFYQQSSPESTFTQKTVCSMANPNGRVTYANGQFIETIGSKKEEYAIDGEYKLKELLQVKFGIGLDGGYDRLLPPKDNAGEHEA